ncbi:MAG TPA: hypothetical protein VK504_17475 [Vicinamibacterales bacterium]|nr:hypothetical protein [Vicinamibacterales bacterium]
MHGLRLIVLLSVVSAHLVVAASEPPLPDKDQFVAQVRARLRMDRALQANYTFTERRQEIEISKLGKVSAEVTKTYEVYPSANPGFTYKRLIAVNGTPILPAELARNDEKHRQDVERVAASPSERAKQQKEIEQNRREEREAIDELFRVYDIHVVGRETLGGYPTIVGTLDPRREYQPRSDDGRMMKRFRARVWIHEFEYQLVKADLESVEDVTIGWGLLARLRKGTKVTLQRTKVNDEVWLPANLRVVGTGRTLIFRGFKIDSLTEWSDYKRFSVSTEESLK